MTPSEVDGSSEAKDRERTGIRPAQEAAAAQQRTGFARVGRPRQALEVAASG